MKTYLALVRVPERREMLRRAAVRDMGPEGRSAVAFCASRGELIERADQDGGTSEPSDDGDGETSGGGSKTTDPPCDPQDDPDCEQPLTDYDRDNIDSAMKLWRSTFTNDEAKEVCAAVADHFRNMYPTNVFRGADDSPLTLDGEDVHHFGAYYDGNIHWDPRYLDGVNDGEYPLSALARSALHEAAHALGYEHDLDGVYDEDVYVWIHSTGPNGCVDA